MAKPAIEEISSPRLLSKFIDPVSFFFNDPPSTPSTVFGSGWEILDSVSTYDSLLVWRGFIDLAGYVEQEKTLFLNGVNIAEAGVIAGNAPLTTVDLVTKRRVSTSQLESYGAAGFSDGATDLYPAGFLGTTHDMDSVLYGRLRYFVLNSTLEGGRFLQLTINNEWGQAAATASKRIHITRILPIWNDQTYGEPAWGLPQACVQVYGVPAVETDLRYIDRLRRSYVVDDRSGEA